MKVTFEPTPNPLTMKFIFPQNISQETADFQTPPSPLRSPLAAKIFGFPWASGVFIGTDFVTITKQDWVDWDIIAEPLAGILEEHLNLGESFLNEESKNELKNSNSQNDSDEVIAIKKILNEEIRPAVAMDGGDITFYKYEDSILYVELLGACSGCPSSMMTLKEGVEARIKTAIPYLKEVIAIS